MRPSIAIISPNTLVCMGLADIIRRMMPGAEVYLFSHVADMTEENSADTFFHYFVSADEVLANASFFLKRQHKTIILVHGNDTCHLPQGFHALNVFLPEKALVASIIALASKSHNQHGAEPDVVKEAQQPPNGAEAETGSHNTPHLTPREREVLKGIVDGLINKEIAARMGVSVATVITHRNNLTEKLGTRSVSALTIFAVMHGIVRL